MSNCNYKILASNEIGNVLYCEEFQEMIIGIGTFILKFKEPSDKLCNTRFRQNLALGVGVDFLGHTLSTQHPRPFLGIGYGKELEKQFRTSDINGIGNHFRAA